MTELIWFLVGFGVGWLLLTGLLWFFGAFGPVWR
jgi:hypothetical protein